MGKTINTSYVDVVGNDTLMSGMDSHINALEKMNDEIKKISTVYTRSLKAKRRLPRKPKHVCGGLRM